MLAASVIWIIIQEYTKLTLKINHPLIPRNTQVSFSHKNSPLDLLKILLSSPTVGRAACAHSFLICTPSFTSCSWSPQPTFSWTCALRGEEPSAHSMAHPVLPHPSWQTDTLTHLLFGFFKILLLVQRNVKLQLFLDYKCPVAPQLLRNLKNYRKGQKYLNYP